MNCKLLGTRISAVIESGEKGKNQTFCTFMAKKNLTKVELNNDQ